jgi:hypothetical protein
MYCKGNAKLDAKKYIIPIKGYEMVEKVAKRSGNSAYLYLPVKWAGKKVKVIALEPVNVEDG